MMFKGSISQQSERVPFKWFRTMQAAQPKLNAGLSLQKSLRFGSSVQDTIQFSGRVPASVIRFGDGDLGVFAKTLDNDNLVARKRAWQRLSKQSDACKRDIFKAVMEQGTLKAKVRVLSQLRAFPLAFREEMFDTAIASGDICLIGAASMQIEALPDELKESKYKCIEAKYPVEKGSRESLLFAVHSVFLLG